MELKCVWGSPSEVAGSNTGAALSYNRIGLSLQQVWNYPR